MAQGLNNCVTIDGLNQIAASFVPKSDATYSLGSSAARWLNAFISGGALFYNGGTNAVTLMAGTLTASRAVTFGDFAGVIVIDTGTQTLTNKTLTAPTINNAVSIGESLTTATFKPEGTSTGQTGTVRMAELAANGANVTGFKAPDALAADVLYTMPTADGSASQFLQTNGSKVLTWAAPSGGVSLIADATNGGLHFSASTGAVTANLAPSDLLTKSTRSQADSVVIQDAAASNVGKTQLVSALLSGMPIQTVGNVTGAVATGTTTMPISNSIPTNTQGDQYMSQAITPTNASSTLIIEVIWNGAISVSDFIGLALFQDTTANALAASQDGQDSGESNHTRQIVLRHKMTAGTTSATTFKVRAGANSAATTTFNGNAGSQQFGGVFSSSIFVTEVLP